MAVNSEVAVVQYVWGHEFNLYDTHVRVNWVKDVGTRLCYNSLGILLKCFTWYLFSVLYRLRKWNEPSRGGTEVNVWVWPPYSGDLTLVSYYNTWRSLAQCKLQFSWSMVSIKRLTGVSCFYDLFMLLGGSSCALDIIKVDMFLDNMTWGCAFLPKCFI